MAESDPVSWLVVEPGWDVHASDGSEVGTVESVVGDEGTGIFNGLAVTGGLLRPTKYVPSERVSEIVEGRVTIAVGPDEFAELDDYGDLPNA